MVSSHSKDIRKNGSFPQVGLKKNIWNHHPGVLYFHLYMVLCFMLNSPIPVGIHQFFMQEIHHQVGMVEKKRACTELCNGISSVHPTRKKNTIIFSPGVMSKPPKPCYLLAGFFLPCQGGFPSGLRPRLGWFWQSFLGYQGKKQKKTPWRKVMARIKRGNGWLPTSDNFA